MAKEIPLKPIFSRKLKNGDYVILAADSEPLVVDEVLAKHIMQGGDVFESCDEETLSVFKDSGFFMNTHTDNTSIPAETNELRWVILRYGLFIVGIIAVLVVLITIPFVGIPIGNQIVLNEVSLWMSITFMICFSIATTGLHEIMHMLYARTWNKIAGGLNIKWKKSVATVSMTHIWAWSLIGRVSAVSAGVVFDLFILSCFSIGRVLYDSWIITTASSILWLRILWQFRFHRNCDGRLMAMMMLDNPMIAVEGKDDIDFASRKDALLWKILKVFGSVVEILIFVFWLFPFAFGIYQHI